MIWISLVITGFLIPGDPQFLKYFIENSLHFSALSFILAALVYVHMRAITNKEVERQNMKKRITEPIPDDFAHTIFLISLILFVISLLVQFVVPFISNLLEG